MEQWKDIKGYEELYQVSDEGRIKSLYFKVELNQIFGSLREVERQLNIPATNISKACRGIYKTAGGYHWEYCDQKKRRGEI